MVTVALSRFGLAPQAPVRRGEAPTAGVFSTWVFLLCLLAGPAGAAKAQPAASPPHTVPREGYGAHPSASDHDAPARPLEMVFLLHGIAKTRHDMAPLAKRLRREGYAVVNWDYSSTKYRIPELADMLAAQVQRFPNYRIHFVTHSMGGIVVRTFFSKHQLPNAGRLVMIAPPSQGAELADFFGNWSLYRYLLGPAGQDLRPGEDGCCASAGIPPVEFGIIAGGTGRGVGINPLLPGDNDGTVTVESTRLEGAQDFALVPYPHPVIQMMPKTADLAVNFLQKGTF